jgi:endonuclease/exonuclease/phosphatase (EEP) superfamily protein YafD
LVLDGLPAGRPVIVGGDFNATPDVAQFRSVLRTGFADAADQAGAGMTRTYPADRWFPPLIAIDHVLTRGGAVATGVQTVSISGSDHRALLARIAVPTDSSR